MLASYMRHFIAALGLLVCFCGCVTEPLHPALKAGGAPRLIESGLFYRSGFNRIDYKLSPDGKRIAWQSHRKNQIRIAVKSIGGDDTRLLPLPADSKIEDFDWLPDSQRLLYTLKTLGSKNRRVYLADIDTPRQPPVDLTPLGTGDAKIHRIIGSDPRRVLIERRADSRKRFDLYVFDIASQKTELMASNPGAVKHWLTDPEGTLRARVRRIAKERWSLELFDPEAGYWQELTSWSLDETVEVLEFTPDDNGFWMLSNRGRDRTCLVKMTFDHAREEVVYQDPAADIESVLVSASDRFPLAAYSFPDYPRIHFFDVDLEADLRALGRQDHSGIHFSSLDASGQLVALSVYNDRGADFYLYNRQTRKKYLFASTPISLFADQLASVRPVTIQARDGFQLNAYLTLPKVPSTERLPMVLLVHGGPWSRDYWHFDSTGQFLANRGYAVLQVNFRGSDGYGRNYKEAAIGEFAGKMHTDLLDAVQWAVDSGFADPEHIGIVGASYGGYAALLGMTFTPDIFACGVSMAGPSDLASLIEDFPDYWYLPIWHRYVGRPHDRSDRKDMETRSPLYRAADVKGPLLIVHGATDERVKIDQSERMVAELRKAGKSVDFVRFENEGHSLNDWDNISIYYRKLEKFLSLYLGGSRSGF